MANPKPLQAIRTLSSKCSVVEANSYRVKNSELLKSEGRMSGISLEKFKIFVGECPDVIRKQLVKMPKVRVGEVVQSGVQRPAA